MKSKGMLFSKEKFLGVLFVVLFSTFLIAGISFDVTVSVVYGNSGTEVGGVLWENTTWTLANSPYIIAETVQIPENVTLTIEPGVSVAKPTEGDMFLVHGTIHAHGTVDSLIVFDGGGNSNFFDAFESNVDTFLDLDYCQIRNGISLCSMWGYGAYGYASLNLKHSLITNFTRYSYLTYPGKDIYIEYNTFVNSAGFSVAHRDTSVFIRNNLFVGKNLNDMAGEDYLIQNFRSNSTSSQTVVKYNSFIDMDGIVLRLKPEIFNNEDIVATENYWGTTDTATINSMIYDKNDDINCANFIDYLPILTEPHPDTPISCEAIELETQGEFTQDTDGKWRCYGNTTITNNSHKNVTLSYIRLKAVNVTFFDESYEALDITCNESDSVVLQPEEETVLNWVATEAGFTKQLKSLTIVIETPVLEAYDSINLSVVVPEFPSWTLMPVILTFLAFSLVLYKQRLFKKP